METGQSIMNMSVEIPARRDKMHMRISLQSILNPFQDHDDSTDDQADLVWDERSS